MLYTIVYLNHPYSVFHHDPAHVFMTFIAVNGNQLYTQINILLVFGHNLFFEYIILSHFASIYLY